MARVGKRSLVIFDFDGTLADTWRDIASALNRTLEGEGLAPVAGPEVRFWIGEGAYRLLEQAVPEAARAPKRLERLYETFRGHYDACCMDTTETYPGIVECLDVLEGTTLAIVSNKPVRFLSRLVDDLGLKAHFRVILGGDSLSVRKPDGQVIEHLLDRLDARPERVYVVGDSAVDVEMGRAAGARTIGCAWGLRGREELAGAGVDVLVEHPREIPAVVLGN